MSAGLPLPSANLFSGPSRGLIYTCPIVWCMVETEFRDLEDVMDVLDGEKSPLPDRLCDDIIEEVNMTDDVYGLPIPVEDIDIYVRESERSLPRATIAPYNGVVRANRDVFHFDGDLDGAVIFLSRLHVAMVDLDVLCSSVRHELAHLIEWGENGVTTENGERFRRLSHELNFMTNDGYRTRNDVIETDWP